MFINQSLKLSNVYPSLFVDFDKLFGHLLRRHFVIIRCLRMTLKIVLFNVFDDIDERSQDLTRRITYTERALCCHGSQWLSTCKASVVDEHEVSSPWSCSHCSLRHRLLKP